MMDCKRRWAIDDDRSRRRWEADEDRRQMRWVVNDDRRRRRMAVDDDRHHEPLWVAQVIASLDRMDALCVNFMHSMERTMSRSATIPAPSLLCSSDKHAQLTMSKLHRDPAVDEINFVEGEQFAGHPLLDARTNQSRSQIHTHASPLPHPPSCATTARHRPPKSGLIGPTHTELPLPIPLHSCDPKPTPASIRAAPPLAISFPCSSRNFRFQAVEAKEKPLYEIGGKKNPASPNSPTLYSSRSLEGYQSRNTHCGSINNINGFANNNKKRGSSVSIRISQEMLENDDEDKGKDFSWSPDPGGTPLPICRVVVASLGRVTVPSPYFLLFFLAGDSSSPRSCLSSTISTEKNDPTTQPALHAICLIKYLTRVSLPPCSDQALENVREIVLYFLTSCSDRNAASLIHKSWFNAETLIQLEFFIGNCYAVCKEKEEWNTPKLRHTSPLKGALNSKIPNERRSELWASLAPQDWKLCISSTIITGCSVKSSGFILVFFGLNQQRMGIFYAVKILNATLLFVEKMGIPDTKTRSRFYASKFATEHSIVHNTVKLGCCDWWVKRSKRMATLEFDRVCKSMSQPELIVFLSRVLLNVFWKEVLIYSSQMIQLFQWTNNTCNYIVLQSREWFILTAYSKMDCFEQTERLFHFMEKMSFISCNIRMLAYFSAGDFFKLVEYFLRLTAKIAPDVHKRLTEEEKVKIRCPVNYEKLSLQSCKQLAQNLRFLPKTVVQVLMSQQSKLKGLLQECNRFKSFDREQKQSKDGTFIERCRIFDPGGLLHSTPSPMTSLDGVEPFGRKGSMM